MTTVTQEQVTAALRETIPLLEQEAVASMRTAVDLTFERESELAPKGATGELSRDIAHVVRKTTKGVSGTVTPLSPHAGFVNFGTGQGKTLRGSQGQAYFALTGHAMTREQELADPFGVATAFGYGSKTPGKPLALHVDGGVAFRPRVRGQRARHFVERTREDVAGEVEQILASGAERATARLFA